MHHEQEGPEAWLRSAGLSVRGAGPNGAMDLPQPGTQLPAARP